MRRRIDLDRRALMAALLTTTVAIALQYGGGQFFGYRPTGRLLVLGALVLAMVVSPALLSLVARNRGFLWGVLTAGATYLLSIGLLGYRFLFAQLVMVLLCAAASAGLASLCRYGLIRRKQRTSRAELNATFEASPQVWPPPPQPPSSRAE